MKNPYILALISGLLLALSWPTYGVSLLIFIAFVPLLYAEFLIRSKQGATKGKVLLTSYITFLVFNAITTWWIYYSTLFGMLFAVLVNSLLMAVVFLIYHLVAKRLPAKIHLVFLPAFWMAFEKFHLNWDFSWPWLNLGNVFATSTNYVQWYEYTGSFGGSLWVWVLNIGFYLLLLKYIETRSLKAIQKGIVIKLLLIALPIIVSVIIKANYTEKGKQINAVIVQPNVDPYSEKYNTSNTVTAKELVKLASDAITDSTALIVAPETVLAHDMPIARFKRSYPIFTLQDFIKYYPNANFLGGISLSKIIRNKDSVGKQTNQLKKDVWYNDYNSAFFLNNSDSIQLYHKSKLVVGVENFPYKWLLQPIFGDVMLDLGGTVAMKTTQENRTPFTAANFKVAPIICYESVYGEFVSEYTQNGAQVLAIITNDAWWSNTQGHKQHVNYARLRAIETRRSVVRSANTGISAIINQTGTIVSALPYNTGGVLTGNVTLNNKVTFYAKYGDYIARIGILVSALILLFAFTRKRNT